jgi:hypothetical protein
MLPAHACAYVPDPHFFPDRYHHTFSPTWSSRIIRHYPFGRLHLYQRDAHKIPNVITTLPLLYETERLSGVIIGRHNQLRSAATRVRTRPNPSIDTWLLARLFLVIGGSSTFNRNRGLDLTRYRYSGTCTTGCLRHGESRWVGFP